MRMSEREKPQRGITHQHALLRNPRSHPAITVLTYASGVSTDTWTACRQPWPACNRCPPCSVSCMQQVSGLFSVLHATGVRLCICRGAGGRGSPHGAHRGRACVSSALELLSTTDPGAGAGCKCRSWSEEGPRAGAEASGKTISTNKPPREDRATI